MAISLSFLQNKLCVFDVQGLAPKQNFGFLFLKMFVLCNSVVTTESSHRKKYQLVSDQNIIDRNVYQLDEESDKSHDSKPN